MKIITRVAQAVKKAVGNTTPVISSTIGYNAGLIRDWFPGAWQRGLEAWNWGRANNDPLENAAIYACISRLAGDFSMMRPKTQKKIGNIWVDDPGVNSFIEYPNQFETVSQFWEHWIISLLTYGNAFIYCRRDAWFILNPQKVRILVATDGSGRIYYDCGEDLQCGLTRQTQLGPDEIIHGRINANIAKNPVLGIPPLLAAALASELGADAKRAAENIYANSSRPGGIIRVPGAVNSDKLQTIKSLWESGYSGANRGKTAVLSDDMEFVPYESANLVDSELIGALRLSAEHVASIFGIPAYRVGLGSYPAYAGQTQADQQYVNGTLQRYIHLTEELLRQQVGGYNRRVHFDPAPLIRMDREKHVAVLAAAIAGSIMSPNEAREELNLPPVPGGEFPLSQQQYYALPALSGRSLTPAANDPEPEPAPLDVTDEPDPEPVKDYQPQLVAGANAFTPDRMIAHTTKDGCGSCYLRDIAPQRDYSGAETYLDFSCKDFSEPLILARVLLTDYKNYLVDTPVNIGGFKFIKQDSRTKTGRKIRAWHYIASEHDKITEAA